MEDSMVLIGAGLPRTGTTSTRVALSKLLKGRVYHMDTLHERPEHRPFWSRSIKHKISSGEWREVLLGYKAGVDYPISFYYKELMEAFPDAKVLLNVRDPDRWYESVRDSIYRMTYTLSHFPCSWYLWMMGIDYKLVSELVSKVPSCSSTGLGLFPAVAAGRESALSFWREHVEEVKSLVPPQNLLVWEVKEGWGPLCEFLDVPVPATPFPWVNDTQRIESSRVQRMVMAWIVVVILPIVLLSVWWMSNVDLPLFILAYGATVLICRIVNNLLNINKTDNKANSIEK